MVDQPTYFSVGNLVGVIPAPPLSAAERHELHQRVPGLRFETAPARTSARLERSTGIQLGSSTIARPAPGAPRALRRAVNAALTLESLRDDTVMLHGVVVARGVEALVILGDYNAGKTRLALALTEHGFGGLAGDLALITAQASVSGGTRAVLSKWPVDAVGHTLPRSDLGLPNGAVRWQAAQCPGGPYPGCNITRMVQLLPKNAQTIPPSVDPVDALRAAVQRARARAIEDADWHAMQQHRPDIVTTQDRLIRVLAARLPMSVIAADFPSCIVQTLAFVN